MAQVTSSGIGVLPSACQPGPTRANPGVFTSATRQEIPSLAGRSSEIQSQKMGVSSRKTEKLRQRQASGSEAFVRAPGQAKPEAKILPFTLGYSTEKSKKWRQFGFGLLSNYKQKSPR